MQKKGIKSAKMEAGARMSAAHHARMENFTLLLGQDRWEFLDNPTDNLDILI